MKISVEDRAQDLLERFSVEAVVQDPCVRLFAQGAYRRSPQRIFVRDLEVRSLLKLSIYKESPSKTSVLSAPGLCTRSLYKLSIRAPLARSL